MENTKQDLCNYKLNAYVQVIIHVNVLYKTSQSVLYNFKWDLQFKSYRSEYRYIFPTTILLQSVSCLLIWMGCFFYSVAENWKFQDRFLNHFVAKEGEFLSRSLNHSFAKMREPLRFASVNVDQRKKRKEV